MSQPCACGRYSIGRCSRCTKPLCGEHGRGSSEFLCSDCEAEIASERNVAAEKQRNEESLRQKEFVAALRNATDPGQILELLGSVGSGPDWAEPGRAAWKTLAASGALRAENEIVSLRFRKPRLRTQEVAEIWRRPAWPCRLEETPDAGRLVQDSKLWIDAQACLWLGERRVIHRSPEQPVPAVGPEVGESSISDPNAFIGDSGFFEKAFLVPLEHPAQMRLRVIRERDSWGKTRKERYWSLIGGGLPMANWSDHGELSEHLPQIVASAL